MNSRDIVELYNDTKNGHVTLTDFINRFNVLTEVEISALKYQVQMWRQRHQNSNEMAKSYALQFQEAGMAYGYKKKQPEPVSFAQKPNPWTPANALMKE